MVVPEQALPDLENALIERPRTLVVSGPVVDDRKVVQANECPGMVGPERLLLDRDRVGYDLPRPLEVAEPQVAPAEALQDGAISR